jgi:dihydrofolate reductase
VMTRDREWAREGAEVAHDVQHALSLAGDDEIAVVGGAEIYALFMDRATRIELTQVDLDVDGDTHMPPLGPEWRETARASHAPSDGRPGFAFVTLRRDL